MPTCRELALRVADVSHYGECTVSSYIPVTCAPQTIAAYMAAAVSEPVDDVVKSETLHTMVSVASVDHLCTRQETVSDVHGSVLW